MNFPALMDTPRLFTALAEAGACMVYILMLRRKYSGKKLFFSLFSMFAAFIAYQLLAGILPIWFWIPMMLGAVVMMCLFIHLLCEGNWKDSIYCGLRAFVLAEFAASLHWQFYVWWASFFKQLSPIFNICTMLLFYSLTLLVAYLQEKNHFPKDSTLAVNGKELTGATLIALGSFTISNLSFALPNTPFSSANSSILYVRTLVDFSGLVMLVTLQDKREELRMRSENQLMNAILQHQYDQYRLSINNMELLRREFHDLKHYMIAIRSEKDPIKKEQYLLEMEEAILTQEALSNTGNGVLDVLLTAKSAYCLQNNITFTCMADGRLLSFMHVKDICSIFGNMLDNAIECVSQFEDPEKRLITLRMQKQNQLLMIQCENYTDQNLSLLANQLPATTKKDKSFHGYGLKSIRHAVEKYSGTMTLQAKDNWFTLLILLPLSEDTPS